jgi:hypothetical protein
MRKDSVPPLQTGKSFLVLFSRKNRSLALNQTAGRHRAARCRIFEGREPSGVPGDGWKAQAGAAYICRKALHNEILEILRTRQFVEKK